MTENTLQRDYEEALAREADLRAQLAQARRETETAPDREDTP